MNVSLVAQRLGVIFPTANRLVGRFRELDLLAEVTGQRRSRLFRNEPYLRLFENPRTAAVAGAAPEITEAGRDRDSADEVRVDT